MTFLRMVPPWAWVCMALAALAGVQTLRLSWEQTAHAQTREDHTEIIAGLANAARIAVEAARTEEQRRVVALQGVVDEAERDLAVARADAAAATDAGTRLRQRVAELTAACRRAPGDPAPPDTGPTTDPTAALLADVQRRLDEASDTIARFADESRAAGLACERGYDALN